MTSKAHVIAQAYSRHTTLVASLEAMRSRGNANPLDRIFIDLGIVAKGDTRAQARMEITNFFDALQARLLHMSIIDMCGQFEAVFLDWVGTAVGESRKAVRNCYGIEILKDVSERFVRERSQYESFDSIIKLLEGKLPTEWIVQLNLLREQRNRSAHGVDLDAQPSISLLDARQLLEDVLDKFEHANQ